MRKGKWVAWVVALALTAGSGCSTWRALLPAPRETKPTPSDGNIAQDLLQDLSNDSKNGWNFNGSHWGAEPVVAEL